MFLSRIGNHIKSQNWAAIGVELIIVIVGVFLAFQVERLYEARRLQSEEEGHLVALRQDFEATRIQLTRIIDIHTRSANAAAQLILDEELAPGIMNYEMFYQLLSDLQRTGTPNFTRRTYDLLISSGEIDTLQNELLKADIDSFYALSEWRESFQYMQLLNFESNVFIPFVNRSLDHVALARSLHFDEAEAFNPPLEEEHYMTVLGTPEFENMVATKWHLSSDYTVTNEILLGLLDNILQTLDQDLRELD